MVYDKEELISTLQANVLRLRSLYEQEKASKVLLEQEKAELSRKLSQKADEIESLEVRMNTLKLAKTLSGANNDMHDSKVKVNNLVREIDKCIALLNR